MIADRSRRWQRRYCLDENVTVVGGRPIRSLSAGRVRQLPEVVLLPGLGAPGYLVPWVQRIAAWTRVTIVDLPGWSCGRGRSCLATVEGIARAAVGWLETTSGDSAVLVGHSTGANAARRTALLAPERLTGLVLAGPVFDPGARARPALARRTLATARREVPAEVAAVAPAYLASAGIGLVRLTRSALADEPENEVGRLTIPVLILTGRLDRLAPPDWGARLAALASGSSVVLPGAHNSCFTHPRHSDEVLHRALTGWASAKR